MSKHGFLYILVITAALVLGLVLLSDVGYFKKQIGYYSQNLTETFSQKETPALKNRAKMEPNRIVINKINVDAPIIYINKTSEDAVQEALQNVVIHYPGTAQIGEKGNAFLFGHSSDFFWSKGNYKTVFALLPKLKPGDIIIVSDKEGYKYEYEVKETLVVSPNDTQYLSQYDKKYTRLTVQTSYPVGTALQRFLVIADLKN